MAAFEGLRIQIASDLHLEFYDELPPFRRILKPAAPVLALLGDISALGESRGQALYEQFLHECCNHFDLILVLVGNHEFYSDGASKLSSQEILDYMGSLSRSNPKVRLLENGAATVAGVRVAGTALWSAVPEGQTAAGAEALGRDPRRTVEMCMNDYRCIFVEEGRGGRRPAEVGDTNRWHRAAVEFLEREARAATAERANLLVLTHHTPSLRGTSHPKHDGSFLNSAFSTDLEPMMQDPALAAIHTWCFGHTHYNSDQVVFGVRLLSNQMGYNHEPAPGYRRDLVVEVPSSYAGRPVDAAGAPGRPAGPREPARSCGACGML